MLYVNVHIFLQLRECGLHLPSSKRLCVRPMPWFVPIPALVRDGLSLQRMQSSVSYPLSFSHGRLHPSTFSSVVPPQLHAAGISAHHITYSEFGAPCVHLFRYETVLVFSLTPHYTTLCPS